MFKNSNYKMENKAKELKKCCYEQPPVREPFILNVSQDIKSTSPFAFDTVHRTSYLPWDPSHLASLRGKTFKPETNLHTVNSDIPMEKDTVMNLSYQPVFPLERKDQMWDSKSELNKPDGPMASETIYRESYRLPGRFVECDEENINKNMIVVYAEDCDEVGIFDTKPMTKHNGL